jgi:tetratricopeptide (TPR) repeat protein
VIPKVKDIVTYWESFFQEFLSQNLTRAPIYWEPVYPLKRQIAPYLRPWRYLWRVSASAPKRASDEEASAYLVDLLAYLTQEFEAPFRISDGIPSCPPASRLGEPDSLSYHARLIAVSAETFKVQKRVSDAITLFELARCFTPRDAGIVNNLGQLYDGLGNAQKAEGMFRHSIVLAPLYVSPRVNLAVLLMSMKRYRDARETLMGVISVAPKVPDGFYQLSVLEEKLGNSIQAERALEMALVFAKKQKDIRAWRAELTRLQSIRRKQEE